MNRIITGLVIGLVMLSWEFTVTVAASTSSAPVLYGSLGGSPAWSDGAIKPSGIYFGAGGDRNITMMRWSHWNASTAYGQGKLYQRICWDSCFKGRITTVGVSLRRIGMHKGIAYFTRMIIWQNHTQQTIYTYSTYGAATVPFWH